MRYLLTAAMVTASFVVAGSVEAQAPPTQARPDYLVNAPPPPVWSNPYAGRVARQRPRRYVRRAHPRAEFYYLPRHYPAQHQLPPIFYGSASGL
jgi:hypothetical protein